MIFNTIKTIIISLSLIALVHYLYTFFKDTLTVPKTRDLVNKPAKRYDEMFGIINNSKEAIKSMNIGQQSITAGQQSIMAGQQSITAGQQSMSQQSMGQQSMQDELKIFLSELKKPNTNTNNNNTNNNNNNINDTFPAANEMTGGYASF